MPIKLKPNQAMLTCMVCSPEKEILHTMKSLINENGTEGKDHISSIIAIIKTENEKRIYL